MNLNIAARILRDDDKFWSIVKDGQKRSDYLTRLHRTRIFSLLLIYVFVFLTLAFQITNKDATIPLFMFVAQAIVYLDTESKIRIIRLYELQATTDTPS